MVRRTAYLAAILVTATAAQALAADAESEFRGRRIAEANCAVCHDISLGQSDNPEAPPFRLLTRTRSLAVLRADMAGDLFTRHPEMPDFEPTPQQLDDIANFIGSISQ
jgi:mono/diheme cytochrome c family protein